MIIYHFTIPATDTADARGFYFVSKRDAVTACEIEAARMVMGDKGLSGHVVEIMRSSLADFPRKELLMRLLNQRGFLRDTVVIGQVQAPTMESE